MSLIASSFRRISVATAGGHFVKLDGRDSYILTTQTGGVAATAIYPEPM